MGMNMSMDMKTTTKAIAYLKINGRAFCNISAIKTPTELMACILAPFADEAHLWSRDTIIRAIKNAEDMASEYFPTRKIRKLQNFDDPLAAFFEKILQGERLGALAGFGLCAREKNEDGGTRILKRFFINPEKQSIVGNMFSPCAKNSSSHRSASSTPGWLSGRIENAHGSKHVGYSQSSGVVKIRYVFQKHAQKIILNCAKIKSISRRRPFTNLKGV